MPRLSIDLTAEEHRKLTAIATSRGQSLREYVLSRTLENVPEVADQPSEDAMAELAAFLDLRAEEAERGETTSIAPGTLTALLKARAAARNGHA